MGAAWTTGCRLAALERPRPSLHAKFSADASVDARVCVRRLWRVKAGGAEPSGRAAQARCEQASPSSTEDSGPRPGQTLARDHVLKAKKPLLGEPSVGW